MAVEIPGEFSVVRVDNVTWTGLRGATIKFISVVAMHTLQSQTGSFATVESDRNEPGLKLSQTSNPRVHKTCANTPF